MDLSNKVKINPLHGTNYYLDMDFADTDVADDKKKIEEIAKNLDKPLQVMISSEEVEKTELLKAAGFAFVEDDEIAYVCGENMQDFHIFAQMLVTELFQKYEVITFEADDCDEMAMELKSMFINQSEESFDTYIREQ